MTGMTNRSKRCRRPIATVLLAATATAQANQLADLPLEELMRIEVAFDPAELEAYEKQQQQDQAALDNINAMIAAGGLTRATQVWSAGMEGWKPAAETELSRLFAQVPPPPPPGA